MSIVRYDYVDRDSPYRNDGALIDANPAGRLVFYDDLIKEVEKVFRAGFNASTRGETLADAWSFYKYTEYPAADTTKKPEGKSK